MQNGYVVTKITRAMLELLAERPLAAITVSDLVRWAGVGRASFYRQYLKDVAAKFEVGSSFPTRK